MSSNKRLAFTWKDSLIGEYTQILKTEFHGYNSKKLWKDLMAGITVAAVALPLALAFGVGSGATAAAGLVTAIIGGIIIGAFSGASFQISGPTGAMAAILITLSAKYGMVGVLTACFFAGIILVVAGVLKMGRMISFIPSSVITGFTSGIAVIIALGQLDNFLGVKSQGSLAILKVLSYFSLGISPNPKTCAIGFFVIAVMIIWPKKWNDKLPSSLLSLILVLIINLFLKWEVPMVGTIPGSILLPERLSIFTIPWGQFWEFFVPALSIAALAMVESLLCGASAGKMKGEKLKGDVELVAQGIGNLIIPFLGGIPATAAIARTSVSIKAGCETRMTGIFHALVLLLSMFLLAPIMSQIPLSALAGVLIVTAWRMNDWTNIHYIFGHRFKAGMAKFLITMVATVVLDLTQAIIIGVAFSMFLIVVKLTDIDINIAEIEPERLEEIGINIPTIPRSVRIAYFTGAIFFPVVDRLKKQLSDLGQMDCLILSMRGVPVIDLSGIQGLLELMEELIAGGTTVYLTSMQPKVLRDLRQGGLHEIIEEDHIFSSAEHAIMVACKAPM